MNVRALLRRFGGIFRKQSRDRELQVEIESHLEYQTEENLRNGMPPDEARRFALLRSGGIVSAKESYRDQRGLPMLETTLQDLRYGLRMLARNPGFATIAVLTLALGIGANTALFSVVNTVLLRPLPYPRSDAVTMVFLHSDSVDRGGMGFADFEALHEQQRSFEYVAASESPDGGYTLTGGSEPENIPATAVTADFFAVLGISPMLGRTFLRGEDRDSQPLTVVVSNRFWREHLKSDPAAVGRTITLNEKPYSIIGVTPPDFHFGRLDNDKIWPILQLPPVHQRQPYFLEIIGRLRPHVSLAGASADAAAIASNVGKQFPGGESATAIVVPLKEVMVGKSRPALLILLASAGMVLLISIVNVANLQIGRAAARHKEIGIRMTLGAGRIRLIRQALTESILIGAIGGILGVTLAYIAVSVIVKGYAAAIPRVHEITVDVRVLGFSAALAVASGILFGLAPIFLQPASRLDETLRQSGRNSTEGKGARRTRDILVVVEFSLAMILLIGAGLLVRSLIRIETVSPGFTPAHILTMQLSLPPAHYMQSSKVTQLYDALLHDIQSSPGVEAAAISMSLPPHLLEVENPFHVEGQIYDTKHQLLAEEIPISEDYFRTLGVPLIAGRFFDDRGRASGHASLIINQTMALRYFPPGEAVGKRLQTGDTSPSAPWETIVGVVGNVKYEGLAEKEQPTMYVPFHSEGWSPWFVQSMFLIVRTSREPDTVTSLVRSRLAGLDRDVPVSQVRTMDELLFESVAEPRFRMILLGAFAGLALLLAAIGIYGVLAYAVERRINEIGVRIAMGAQQHHVLSLVLSHGVLLAAIGIAVGTAGALSLTRLLGSLLFQVTTTDPFTFVAVPAVLLVAALTASYIPARRAMRVDPLVALRYE